MAFVNEHIPKEDWDKYNFVARKAGHGSRDWTVDREADIWIRHLYTESDHTEPDGGFTGVKAWDFYWKGTLMLIKMKDLDGGGGMVNHAGQRNSC